MRAGQGQDTPPHCGKQIDHHSLATPLPLLLQDYHHRRVGAAGGEAQDR